jgi:hypothetical protein
MTEEKVKEKDIGYVRKVCVLFLFPFFSLGRGVGLPSRRNCWLSGR